MKEPLVDILLATYNGADFLSDQLDSILNQSYKNWKLIIRDDYSSDNTSEIIKYYLKKDSRIELLVDEEGNLGHVKNFERLMTYSNAQYIMLSDQDDIWMKEKIMSSMKLMLNCEQKDIPTLIFSNSIVVQDNINTQKGTLYNVKLKPSLSNFLFWNAGYQGASMLLNKSLLSQCLPFLNNCPSHDYHISLIALYFGNVRFHSSPLAYYRRHNNTTTLNNRTIRSRIIAILEGRSQLETPNLKNYFVLFIKHNKLKIKNLDIKISEDYLKIINGCCSLKVSTSLIISNKFTLRESSGYLIFKTIINKILLKTNIIKPK